MLSPSISTNSNGNTDRDSVSRSPTWYCGFSPVPLSPITAKRSDLSACGACVPPAAGAAAWLAAPRTGVAACQAASGSAPSNSVSSSAGRGDGRWTRVDMVPSARDDRDDVAGDVDDDVGGDVAQHDVVADDAVFQLRRQLGQLLQE